MPDKIFNWDDTISYDGDDYILLKEGDYNFEVTGLEHGRASTDDAPMAILKLKVTGDNGESTTVTDRIALRGKLEWKISQFFRSLGMKKHGEKFKMNWDAVVGRKGRCRVGINEYKGKDGTDRKNNKIQRYYDPIDNNKVDW